MLIGNIRRGDLVDDFGRRDPQHPLGADIEDLDDPLGVGGDAGEIGAIEDSALECARLQQHVFRRLGPIAVMDDVIGVR